MKSIISINYKFMELPSRELLELVAKYADGMEVYVDYHQQAEVDYLDEIVALMSDYKLRLQIHGESTLSLPEQKEFLARVNNYRSYDGPILVTLHSIYDEDIYKSVERTKKYFDEILEFVEANCPNIEILIENLNDWEGHYRLKMADIAPVIKERPRLGVTYDIGHVLADGEKDLIGDSAQINDRIKNLHIHTCRSMIEDHLPIYKGDKNWQLLIDALRNFGDIPVVFEYNLFECRGETTHEKVVDYLQTFAPVISAASK